MFSCVCVVICAHVSEVHGASIGSVVAGNTCFWLTGPGRVNEAGQLHKGNKKEASVLLSARL